MRTLPLQLCSGFVLRVCFVLALMIVASAVHSQGAMPSVTEFMTTEPVPKPNAPEIGDRMVAMVNAMMTMVQNLWRAGAPPLTTVGLSILGSLVVLSVGWTGLRVVGGMSDMVGAIAEIVKTMAVASLVYAAISPSNAWAPFIGNNVTLGQFVSDGFFRLSGMSQGSWLTDTLSIYKSSVVLLWQLPIVPESLTGFSALTFVLTRLDVIFFVAALKVIATVLLILACVVTLGHLLMATVQIGLNLFLAPIFVPWLLFKPMSYLFMGWLKSMISAGLLAFVGYLFAKAGYGFMQGVQVLIPNGAAGIWYAGNEVAAFYVSLILATLLFLFIAMKLDRLAAAVMSGSTAPGTSLMDMYFVGKTTAGAVKGGISAAKSAGATVARTAAGMNAVASAGIAKQAAATAASARSFGSLGGTPVPQSSPLSFKERFDAYRKGSQAYTQSRRMGESIGGAFRASSTAGSEYMKRVSASAPAADSPQGKKSQVGRS